MNNYFALLKEQGFLNVSN